MTRHVTFRRRWFDRVSAMTTILYHKGWSGYVADAVADDAMKAGVLRDEGTYADSPTSSAGTDEGP
jgi:hypothetical protein